MAFYDRSNKEVAADLGISKQRLSNYLSELNRPPVNMLQKIAALFEISLDFLVNDKYELHIIYRNEQSHQLPAVAEPKPQYKTRDEILNLLDSFDEDQRELFIQLLKTFKGEK
jgi:transcriptional regulator with XRE-family HTH domain